MGMLMPMRTLQEVSTIRILFGIVVLALPLFIGSLFRSRSASLTYLSGNLLMWAAFQVLAVPMVYLRLSFTALFWSYTALVAVLTVLGLRCRMKLKFDKPEVSAFLIIALLVVAYQCYVYIFGMHLDEDDSRWIAEANDALVRNRMLLYNPANGEYLGAFLGEISKDVFSPWCMFIAWMSRATGINAPTLAHTVYAPVLLGLSYIAYYHVGRALFRGRDEQGLFLLMVSVINLFMAGNPFTQSVFSLTRIWQGKAVVAAVMIPTFLLYMLRFQAENADGRLAGDTPDNWAGLISAAMAACLLSGMGIAIGLVMIAVLGAYVVARGLIRRQMNWRHVLFWLLSMAPSLACGLGYKLLT